MVSISKINCIASLSACNRNILVHIGSPASSGEESANGSRSMKRQCATAKIERGHVKLYDERGIYMGNIAGNDAVAVDVSAAGVSIHLSDQRIRLYSLTGQYIRTI
jgi:hypothetical protein